MNTLEHFLDKVGLTKVFSFLKTNIDKTNQTVQDIRTETDIYVIDVDYSQIAFDTTEVYTKVLEGGN